MRSHSECQPHIHTRTVALNRCVQELFDLGKGDDFVELAFDLSPAHAQDGAIQEDVFAPGQFRVEAGADLQQAGHAAFDLNPPGGGRGDAAQQLEQRRFPGPIPANDADRLPTLNFEGNISKGPEFLARAIGLGVGLAESHEGFGLFGQHVPEGFVAPALLLVAEQILFAQALDFDGNIRHNPLNHVGERPLGLAEVPYPAGRHREHEGQ